MSLLGSRKSRTARAAQLRNSSSPWVRLTETLRDSGVLLRLIISVCAIIGFVFAVQGWKSAFPHRMYDRTESGIAARDSFDRENKPQTERARDKREEFAPLVFRRDSELLDGLEARFRNHLREVAEASDLTELSTEARRAFGIADPTTDPEKSAGLEQEFATIKAAISSGGDSVGSRIDEIVADFVQLVTPLKTYGVVDPIVESELSSRSDANVEIIEAGEEVPSTTLSELFLTEQIKDSGQLGKNWNSYPQLASIRPMLERWLTSQVKPTLTFDSALTEERRQQARNSVQPVLDAYARGAMLVKPGEVINNEAMDLLKTEFATIESRITPRESMVRLSTVVLLFTVLAFLFGVYLSRNEPRITSSARSLAVFLSVCVVAVFLSRWLSYDPWRAEIIPLLATVMVFAIAINQVLAMVTAFVLAIVISLSTVSNIGQFVILTATTATAIIPLTSVPTRSTITKVGFLTGAVCFCMTMGTGLIQHQIPGEFLGDSQLLSISARNAFCCFVASLLVASSLPFVESTFGVITDISLLEMSTVSHPLLQELVRRAPGTYNHSIAVATIGEAAAESIGANGLLLRVGAYFHDIGKMLKPEYFIENMSANEESRHHKLAPAMSTLIIIGHVKDGVDLAKQHNLPPRLIDFIEQHHGTTLVEYFFREAERQADEDHKTDAEESSFRYPGPKPQSREAGIMMLSDAVESASRTLSEPTPKRIETLVHELTMKRLLDGQFDECSLKLSEIKTVEESLVKSLIGIYHGRIKYPEQQSA